VVAEVQKVERTPTNKKVTRSFLENQHFVTAHMHPWGQYQRAAATKIMEL